MEYGFNFIGIFFRRPLVWYCRGFKGKSIFADWYFIRLYFIFLVQKGQKEKENVKKMNFIPLKITFYDKIIKIKDIESMIKAF